MERTSLSLQVENVQDLKAISEMSLSLSLHQSLQDFKSAVLICEPSAACIVQLVSLARRTKKMHVMMF